MSKIKVEFSGTGYQVGCYVVNDEILDQLMSATEEDALYEDNPFSLIRDIGEKYTLVANGFELQGDTYQCRVNIDSEETEIVKFGTFYNSEPYDEQFDTPRELTLFAEEEKYEILGKDFILAKNEGLIVEVIDMKEANLFTYFETSLHATVNDLEIIVMDLDMNNDLSLATYGQGLLQGMDKDIRAISCFGQNYDLELEIINSYPSSFYHVKRNKLGEWESEYLG